MYFSTQVFFTILILEKLTRLSSVQLGVPSSMKARSVRYIPRQGTQGGSQLGTPGRSEGDSNCTDAHTKSNKQKEYIRNIQNSSTTMCEHPTGKRKTLDTYFFSASLRFLNRPSDDTSFCNLSITVLVQEMDQRKTVSARNQKCI